MPAAIGLVDLGVLLALALLIALSYAYNYTLGAAIVGIAKAIGSLRLPGIVGGGRVLGFAADALEKIDHSIRHSLGVGIEAMQATWNECVSYTAQAFHWIGKEIASLSHDTAQAVEGLMLGQVKPWVNRRLVAALAAVAALKARVLALERSTVAHVTRAVHVVEHKTVVIARAVSVPDIGAIPRAIPGFKWLEREAGYVRGEIKRVAKVLTPAGIIGLVGATVFTRFGLGWLRCKGVGRVGRSLCGASSMIEALYAGAITAFAVSDLCRFAYGIERAAETIRPLMLEFVDVENALFGCSSADFPRPLVIAPTSPTPVIDAVAL